MPYLSAMIDAHTEEAQGMSKPNRLKQKTGISEQLPGQIHPPIVAEHLKHIATMKKIGSQSKSGTLRAQTPDDPPAGRVIPIRSFRVRGYLFGKLLKSVKQYSSRQTAHESPFSC